MTQLPADILANPALQRLCRVLTRDGGAARLVGGVVRDALLGLPVQDIDIATPLLPAEVITRLEVGSIKAVPTGIAHGTITAVVDGHPFEITTLRRDVATDGRRATVAFSNDWAEDASRRDFTFNALYADPASGVISDYTSGLDDLAARRVRFIGDAAARIAEDHLRILRYFRFLARFGDVADADPDTLATISAHANSLMALSRERIWDELRKILSLPDPSPVVALMIDTGVFAPIVPEIIGAQPLSALTAAEQAQGFAPSSTRRLAALLALDAEAADAVAVRLRLSKAERKGLVLACSVHPDANNPAVLAYGVGKDAAMDYLLLRGRDATVLRPWERPTFPLTGGMIVAMGVAAGPDVARILQAVERQWLAEDFPDADRVGELVSAAVLEKISD